MRSLSSIGVGLSVVFTCLLLFLFVEIYYLLWWKRRMIRREIDGYNTNPTREFLFLICWKNKNLAINPTNTPQPNQTNPYQNFQFHTNNDHENNMETHQVIGQPRFLFPIEEETKEDLESEDGKPSRDGKRCLSDLLTTTETPYMTPLSSPSTTPLGSSNSTGSRFQPHSEDSSDTEFNGMIRTSPPSTFKFLREAEEKLKKKMMKMEEGMGNDDEASLKRGEEEKQVEEEEDGSFITIIFDRSDHHHCHSPYCPSTSITTTTCSSQVLPSASFPSSLPNQMVECSHKTTK